MSPRGVSTGLSAEVKGLLRSGAVVCSKELEAMSLPFEAGQVSAMIAGLRRRQGWSIDRVDAAACPLQTTKLHAHYVLVHEPEVASGRAVLAPSTNGHAPAPAGPAGVPGQCPALDESLVVCALIRREDGTLEMGLRGAGRTWHVEVVGHTS